MLYFDNSYHKMKNIKMTPEQAKKSLMRLCSLKEMCLFDLLAKMDVWEINKKDQEEIIKYLREERYFNDKRYAAAFINDKSTLQKWGRIKIKQALKSKQVADLIIEDLFEESNELLYIENLEGLLLKKLRSLRGIEQKLEIKARLYRFALGKGYEPDLICAVLKKLVID
jgi:regulatory protein